MPEPEPHSRGLPQPAHGEASASVFDGKAALIFGGGRNIGAAMAREFARRGARVAIADLDLAGAETTARSVRDAGREAAAFGCDVTDSAALQATAVEVEARFGTVDIVMNNAGLLHSGEPQDIPIAEWERMLGCNFMGGLAGRLHLRRDRGGRRATEGRRSTIPHTSSTRCEHRGDICA